MWSLVKKQVHVLYIMNDTEDKSKVWSMWWCLQGQQNWSAAMWLQIHTHCFLFFAYNTFDSIQRPEDIWSRFGSSICPPSQTIVITPLRSRLVTDLSVVKALSWGHSSNSAVPSLLHFLSLCPRCPGLSQMALQLQWLIVSMLTEVLCQLK